MATPSSIPLPLTGDDVIDAATSGYYWELDISRTVNWSLADGISGESWISTSTVSPALTDFVFTTLPDMFTNISSYATIQFNYVGYHTDPSEAYVFGGSDITISLDGFNAILPDDTFNAIGFFPDASNDTSRYLGAPGDIFLNTNNGTTFKPSYVPGSDGYALCPSRNRTYAGA